MRNTIKLHGDKKKVVKSIKFGIVKFLKNKSVKVEDSLDRQFGKSVRPVSIWRLKNAA